MKIFCNKRHWGVIEGQLVLTGDSIEKIKEMFPGVVEQDRWALERQQEMFNLPDDGYQEVHLRADKSIIILRKILEFQEKGLEIKCSKCNEKHWSRICPEKEKEKSKNSTPDKYSKSKETFDKIYNSSIKPELQNRIQTLLKLPFDESTLKYSILCFSSSLAIRSLSVPIKIALLILPLHLSIN